MHLRQYSRRIGLGTSIAFTMLAICLIAYNAQSNCEPSNGGASMDIAQTQVSGAIRPSGPAQHPKPWVKIVVTHLIAIAGKLAAS